MSKLETLFSKEMSRQQFLKTLGLAFVALFGISSLMGILTHNAPEAKDGPVDYGMQNYGP
jgi:hypothetical protein